MASPSTNLLRLAACCGWLLAAASGLAQSASNTAGFQTYTLPATTAATVVYLSVPMKPPMVLSGTPTAVGSDTITVATSDWVTNAYAGSRPYYVYVQSGAQAGRVLRVLANTGTQLTLDLTDNSAQTTDLATTGFAMSTADTFELRVGHTLATFFGATAAAIPLTTTGTPDTVSLWNWRLNAFDTYRFDSGGANTWVDAAGANANETIIPPNATLAIARGANHVAAQLVVLGEVPTIAPLIKVGSGGPRYFGSELPMDLTFSQLALGSSWLKSALAFTADTVSLYSTTLAKWESFYQQTDGTWHKSGSPDAQDSTPIPAGSALVFTRRGTISGSASFVPVTLPYTP